VHWLQNALPLLGMGRRIAVSVLGTDYAMLRLPGMTTALRRVFASNDSVLTPNAPWMAAELERRFGDVARVAPVNFGIDDLWYSLERSPAEGLQEWLCVSRITEGKIGDLFRWGEETFTARRQLTLIGPNQGDLSIPNWVSHAGAATPEELAAQWFPRASGLVSLSRHAEGRPQVMLEAMAAGLPIVASTLPAHMATVVDGNTGFLVDSREAFLTAMQRLEDPALGAQLGAAARETARIEFGTWADCAARFDQVYRSLP
jgi:glycosyltransferase involved in cell wall biosynthesis